MSSGQRSWVQVYGGALVAVAAAVGARELLAPMLGARAPLFPFIAALVFACWWGGWRGAVLTTVASMIVVETLVEPAVDAVTLGIFALVCVLVILLTEAIRAETRRLAASERTVRALQRITARLNSTLDVDELLDLLAQDATDLLGAAGGMSGLHTVAGMVTRRAFGVGGPHALLRSWPSGQGLPGWLLANKRPYRSDNAATDPQIDADLRDQLGIINALAVPIVGSQGEVHGFVAVHNKSAGFTNTDEERLIAVSQVAATAIQNALAYRRLREVEVELTTSDRRKDEFLATLAHELRNPLAPLRNAIDVMRLAPRDPRAAENARGIMQRQLQQLVRLIDDLLDVSRITTNRLELRLERINLVNVLQAAVETAQPLLSEKGHKLFHVLPQGPLYVDADSTRLAQVFANLLNNAAKFTPPGGHIRLTVERHGDAASICVQDTGVGFEGGAAARLFEMFAHGAPDTAGGPGGLGVGLALARRLVELHGGQIRGHSEGLGRGAEFVVTLPLRDGPAPHVPEPVARAAESRSSPTPFARTLRVLVVDDNQDATESLAMLLRMVGYAVRTAFDGEGALAAAAAFHPDVIVLDIGLPGMTGYEVAHRLRGQPDTAATTLIALTGWGQEQDRRLSRAAGFDHHVTKPGHPDELVKILERLKTKEQPADGR
jgi:signal transduction histidine kinase/ActR/RegA family two-component response regulator